MSVTQLLVFAGVVVLGAMAPGPDFAVVMRHSVLSGRATGMATAAGVATGVLVWAVAAATGITALVAVASVGFTVVKVVGAAYLVYCGVQALRSAWRVGRSGTGADAASAPQSGPWAAFRDGLLCNVLNPKAAIFFMALLPQFLPDGAVAVEALVLSVVAASITAVWFVAVAALIAAVRRVLSRPGVRRGVDALSGVVLIGFGVRLAFSAR
ncbi:LysE family translocator [Micromonospora sp. CPCC 206060]|uniref:LysE family translocator n=1 Tax=Micromonospora sp. CPCC 206060 TaxID=3122406 RepID=UPI002FF2FC06